MRDVCPPQSFGTHRFAAHATNRWFISFDGSVAPDEMASMLEFMAQFREDADRHTVIVDVRTMGKFGPEARRRLASFRFGEQQAEDSRLVIICKDVVQRGIMTLVAVAARLSRRGSVTHEFVADMPAAERAVEKFLERA